MRELPKLFYLKEWLPEFIKNKNYHRKPNYFHYTVKPVIKTTSIRQKTCHKGLQRLKSPKSSFSIQINLYIKTTCLRQPLFQFPRVAFLSRFDSNKPKLTQFREKQEVLLNLNRCFSQINIFHGTTLNI